MSLYSPSPKPYGQGCWRVVEGQTLRWRCWAGEYAVFNPLSGQTHFLDIVTGQVLRQLMAGSLKIDELCATTSEFLEVPNDDKIAAMVADILTRLEAATLVEHLD